MCQQLNVLSESEKVIKISALCKSTSALNHFKEIEMHFFDVISRVISIVFAIILEYAQHYTCIFEPDTIIIDFNAKHRNKLKFQVLQY